MAGPTSARAAPAPFRHRHDAGPGQLSASFSAFPALNDTPDGPADGDALAGARVAALARRPLGPHEPAEARDGDILSARQRLGDRREHGPDRGFGLLLRNTRLGGDALDDIPLLYSLDSPVSHAVAGATRDPIAAVEACARSLIVPAGWVNCAALPDPPRAAARSQSRHEPVGGDGLPSQRVPDPAAKAH